MAKQENPATLIYVGIKQEFLLTNAFRWCKIKKNENIFHFKFYESE
jgi:hypothetical protein